MKTILKSTRFLLLLLLIITVVNVEAKSKSASDSRIYFLKATTYISPYFRAAPYPAGDYWGIGLIIHHISGTDYEGSAVCGLFNNHVYIPGYYIPGDLTVTASLNSSSYSGTVSAVISAGQTSSNSMAFTSTYSPTISYSGCSPSYFGTPPNSTPVFFEAVSYQ